MAYRTLACLPALAGSWRHEGGGLSYVPVATLNAVDSSRLRGVELRPRPARMINMAQIGRALCDPDLAPPIAALVVWGSNPAQVAPDQACVLAGLARDDLFVLVLEQFLTDTARHADVVLPATTALEHRDVLFSWGHHYVTLNEPAIAPLGEAKPNTEIFRLLAARLGLDDPCFGDTDDQLLDALLAGGPPLPGLRERGWAKVDLGQGAAPHADGGFGTANGRAQLHASYVAPAEVADAALAERYPLALITPKTHLFLNSTFANQDRQRSAQPHPVVVINPADAGRRAIGDGGRVRVFNDRGSFGCVARVSDDAPAGVVVAPMGWWNADHGDGVGAQATTSQALTELGAAPTFNDNRVEVAAAEGGGE
jgi:anaerobic selenocysteine-containing dehydrogenase